MVCAEAITDKSTETMQHSCGVNNINANFVNSHTHFLYISGYFHRRVVFVLGWGGGQPTNPKILLTVLIRPHLGFVADLQESCTKRVHENDAGLIFGVPGLVIWSISSF